MKAVYTLVFLLVALLAMDYRVDSNTGDHIPINDHRSGTIFDTAASIINGII